MCLLVILTLLRVTCTVVHMVTPLFPERLLSTIVGELFDERKFLDSLRTELIH